MARMRAEEESTADDDHDSRRLGSSRRARAREQRQRQHVVIASRPPVPPSTLLPTPSTLHVTVGAPSLTALLSATFAAPLLPPAPTLAPESRLHQEPPPEHPSQHIDVITIDSQVSSAGKGILIGMLSAFSSAAVVAIVFTAVYLLRYTRRGRIILDRIGRPGEFDDEQALAREEAEALEQMDDIQRAEYLRAKSFVEANPPDSVQTDISLSQFLAIQEKGVSAWEFEPELEIANCFVEARTEIEFYDSVCTVQSNLPVPKQNEVYYWEAKIYDKPESTVISIGMATKPYPLFRLPGWHKYSVAYVSTGHRRYNQPFTPTPYGPTFVQGDVVGVGYRPRTGTIFFTRNGRKLDDVAHGLKSQNLFPSVGANGPCTVHVNFGQMGFVFIEANVKKWGLAPMTGSLAPPPPYGSEQGSILLEAATGREGPAQSGHYRSRSAVVRAGGPPPSPGPMRSPTDISLAQLEHIPSHPDVGEGSSRTRPDLPQGLGIAEQHQHSIPPPEYTSPVSSRPSSPRDSTGPDDTRRRRCGGSSGGGDAAASAGTSDASSLRPPIPSYDSAISARTESSMR